ncbi:hypothetical protein EJB05_12056, partial [Eragrostis curvula]
MAMAARLLSYLAASVLLAFALAPPRAAGDPLGQFCGSSGNYTAKSTYQANIQSLASTLPKNTSSSRTLFATAQTGSLPDVVYALALCRGDTNASACESCVAGAFTDAQQLCAYNKDATIFYDPCLLRYSNQNFIGSTGNGDDKVLILMNTQNVSAPFRVFDAAVGVLVNATANYAATNSSSRFGTAVEAQKPKLYGLAQCTPDMTPADCRTCLGGVIQMGQVFQREARWQDPRTCGATTGTSSTPSSPAARCFSCRSQTWGAGAGAGAASRGERDAAHGRRRIQRKQSRENFGHCIAYSCRGIGNWNTLLLYLEEEEENTRKADTTNPEDIHSIDSLIIDLSTLRAATENFDEGNKLGEGGFGAVYKGVLPGDQEIAVKRLSQTSRQGIEELKNELVLVAKLQHKNLVRLVGVCLEDHERLLVYEYMPNKSLDTILFGMLLSSFSNSTTEIVWEHWTTRTLMEIMDSSLSSLAPRDQMLKCLHIGLLCVQDDPVDRPMMSVVNIMLSSSTVTLQAPSRPAFCVRKYGTNSDMYSEVYGASQSASRSPMSLNDVSITELEPR